MLSFVYDNCQQKCQGLAVVHITVLRLINGSESDKQKKQQLSSFWVKDMVRATTLQHFVPSLDCVNAKSYSWENI